MTTARQLFRECKCRGIALADGGNGTLRTKGDLDPDLRDRLIAAKPELLALLKGDYLRAGAYLVLRFAQALDEQDELAERYDERAAICQHDGGLSRGEAERKAYLDLTHHIESLVKP